MPHYDYLLLGQGFAGSILTLSLQQCGKSVCIVDDATYSRCSRVAAGMLNPVNFQTMKATWKAAETVPFAHTFYKEIEAKFNASFFTRRPYYRILGEDEKTNWPREKQYFGNIIENPFPGIVGAPFGAGSVEDGGNLDTRAFYEMLARVFPEKRNMRFDFSALDLSGGEVRYHDITANRLVLCAGFREMHETFFSFVPFKALKGQILHLDIPRLQTDAILNGAGYLVPRLSGGYAFGATHERDLTDEITTDAGREELEMKLRKMITAPFRVTGVVAGIRPTVRDHRPVLGTHPQFPQLALFNGLGSKGVMQAPWLAAQLIAFLEKGLSLPKEVDLRRFVN